jgi:hypothetical protein
MAGKTASPAPKAPAETTAKTASKSPAKPTVSAAVKPAAEAPPARKPKAGVAKPVAKPAAKANLKASSMVEAIPGKQGKKPSKPRPVLVRDSFTMPEADFALIAKLKAKALGARRAAKKSELLRAGLQLLAGLDADSLVVVLDRLETVKTGRPKKGH